MTDAEVICAFMESRPEFVPIDYGGPKEDRWEHRWWKWYAAGSPPRHLPVALNLDKLHEVEARLSEGQWESYRDYMAASAPHGDGYERFLLHADAEQKIKALAAVIGAEGGREPRP
jgi:hypothetical protein